MSEGVYRPTDCRTTITFRGSQSWNRAGWDSSHTDSRHRLRRILSPGSLRRFTRNGHCPGNQDSFSESLSYFGKLCQSEIWRPALQAHRINTQRRIPPSNNAEPPMETHHAADRLAENLDFQTAQYGGGQVAWQDMRRLVECGRLADGETPPTASPERLSRAMRPWPS